MNGSRRHYDTMWRMNTLSRRVLLAQMAAGTAATLSAQRITTWKPKLGTLGRYTDANVAFTKSEGFTSMVLDATPKSTLNPENLTDDKIAQVKSKIAQAGLMASAFQCTVNHTPLDPQARAKENAYFARVIELAGKLGIPYVGTASGHMPGRPLAEQVDNIVRVYNEQYFPVCERAKVRILWEPWPDGPNIATSPVGYDALFKAFNNSPYVGLQYDPSHLVRQWMDPIQTARDYVDKIYDVHLKDTEIRTAVLKRGGIRPVDGASWWRYRLPGLGSIDWAAFFTVLQDAGYHGAMNIEHEDATYGWPNRGDDWTEEYRTGFRMAKRYLQQYVPV